MIHTPNRAQLSGVEYHRFPSKSWEVIKAVLFFAALVAGIVVGWCL